MNRGKLDLLGIAVRSLVVLSFDVGEQRELGQEIFD